jgi:hypothetical protein
MIGAVLVQPQRVRRTQAADPATILVSELSNLATRLITDADEGGRIAAIAGEAAELALHNFITGRLATAEAAAPRLRDWLLRVIRATTGITPDLRVGTPAQGIELVRTLLEHVGSSAQNIDAARIRPYVADLLHIVQVEFDISLPALEGMLWQIVDDIITRLEAEPAEAQRTARENRLDTIRMLRRIKRLVRGRFPLPVIDADRIANGIAEALRRIDADVVGRHLSCISQSVGAVSDATRAVEDLVPIGVTAFNSLGAAAAATAVGEKYCWYASWLFGSDVVINDTHTEIRKGNEVIATGVNLTVRDIPQFQSTTTPRYTFQAVDVDGMEAMAYGMHVFADGLDAILHLVSLEKGDYANNLLNSVYFSFLAVAKGIAGRPLMHSAIESVVIPGSLSLIASLEGIHKKATGWQWLAMWSSLLAADALETTIYRVVSSTARDAVLSLFTLINYDGDFYSDTDPDPRPLNRMHIDGVVAIPGLFTSFWQFSRSTFPREEYSIIGADKDLTIKQIFYWNMLIGSCFTIGARLSGCLLAMGIGRNFDEEAWWNSFKLGPVPLLRIPFGWVTWFISMYMSVEGDTKNGTMNTYGQPFAGYQPYETSPYTLPYPKDNVVYVVQGHQGIFSHHHNSKQTYSYDFCLDQDAVILAARPGTVVDYFDWIENNIEPNDAQKDAAAAEAFPIVSLVNNQTRRAGWNFIRIRHDCDDDGNPLSPNVTHDKGEAGATVTTYAVYGHGRKGSVREMFQLRGIGDGSIIGSKVKRGHRIMRSGDTGLSFMNHLHIHVQAGPAAAPTTPPAVRDSDLVDGSIPFVFSDVTHFIGTDGVPRYADFYESSVTAVP